MMARRISSSLVRKHCPLVIPEPQQSADLNIPCNSGYRGSVATIKLPNIIQALSKYPSSQLSIRVVLTPSASRFLAGQSKEQPTISGISSLPNVDAYVTSHLCSRGKCRMKIVMLRQHTHLWQYIDADEWKVPWVRGAGILHIELRRWADLLVIAPLSANTLAKIVGGFSDSLLTSVVRAWDPWGEQDTNPAPATAASTPNGTNGATRNRRLNKRRIIVAPAMNTAMWRHPITAKQLRVLEEEWGVQKTAAPAQPDDGSVPGGPPTPQETGPSYDEGDGWFEVLRPQSKVLACGDAGDGAMLEWSQIVTVIEDRLGLAV
ncbi:putative flavoprotein [Xylaria cf. heliscus]|nr:putative flavoprotein [Xylaria cf. heliscus]